MAKKNSRSKPAVPLEPAKAPEDLSADLGQIIRDAAPGIVTALIDEAKKGNCTPAKFLFDFAGLHSAAAPDNKADDSLAALLLKELARPQPQQDETPGTIQ